MINWINVVCQYVRFQPYECDDELGRCYDGDHVINTPSKGQRSVMKTIEDKQEVYDVKWNKPSQKDVKKWSLKSTIEVHRSSPVRSTEPQVVWADIGLKTRYLSLTSGGTGVYTSHWNLGSGIVGVVERNRGHQSPPRRHQSLALELQNRVHAHQTKSSLGRWKSPTDHRTSRLQFRLSNGRLNDQSTWQAPELSTTCCECAI